MTMAPVDDLEIWFDKGVTDGLPVIPPSRARVERMLAASARARDDLVGEVAPNYGRATVEKIAINAVMAGCRPEYFPVVLAAVEAACDPSFNLHGVSTSTHFSSPLDRRPRPDPYADRPQLLVRGVRAGPPRQRHHRARPAARR